jgi:hypothetical protein
LLETYNPWVYVFIVFKLSSQYLVGQVVGVARFIVTETRLYTSMADTENVTVASNVLGTIGTVLWCIQLIPQIWYNWQQKKTDGLPPSMMFLWASCMLHLGSALFRSSMADPWSIGAVPMGAYLILQVQVIL